MKKQKTRRDFIKSGAIATGAVAATPYFNWSAKAFANQEKMIGLISGVLEWGAWARATPVVTPTLGIS